jgi:pre-mRNA-splicing factor SPF27
LPLSYCNQLERPPKADQQDPAAWEKALNNASAQLEHQNTRILNLELYSKFGQQAWRAHNIAVESQQTGAKKALRDAKAGAEALNARRKQVQERNYGKLSGNARKWDELIAKNFQIELVCAQMEREVKKLRTEATAAGAVTEEECEALEAKRDVPPEAAATPAKVGPVPF